MRSRCANNGSRRVVGNAGGIGKPDWSVPAKVASQRNVVCSAGKEPSGRARRTVSDVWPPAVPIQAIQFSSSDNLGQFPLSKYLY